MQTPPVTSLDDLLSDHRRLESRLESVVSALEANDRAGASELWAECRVDVAAHMDAEEQHLIPARLQRSERDARILVLEHRHIRSRLSELEAVIASPRTRSADVRDFIDELRAHHRSEERLLYPP